MSTAERLRAALAPLGLPCYQNEYTEHDPVYFVFNISTIPADYADDAPAHERHLIQLHLYAPKSLNTSNLQAQVKQALFGALFLYPSTENASDNDAQHLVFETETVQEAVYGTI